MKKLGNRGFTLVEGLLVVFVLTVMGGVGFYVVKSNKDDKKESTSMSTSTAEQKSESKKEESKNTPPTLDQAVVLAKEYYHFRYIDKWNEQIPKEQLDKWLVPSLIDRLAQENGYQGGADSDNITHGGGFTIPDSIQAKGKSSDDTTATVELIFVYDTEDSDDPRIMVTLVPGGASWLIASAKLVSR